MQKLQKIEEYTIMDGIKQRIDTGKNPTFKTTIEIAIFRAEKKQKKNIKTKFNTAVNSLNESNSISRLRQAI